jgi:hypothetical protein
VEQLPSRSAPPANLNFVLVVPSSPTHPSNDAKTVAPKKMKPSTSKPGVASFFKSKKGGKAADGAGGAGGAGGGREAAPSSFGDLGVPANMFDNANSGWDDNTPTPLRVDPEDAISPLLESARQATKGRVADLPDEDNDEDAEKLRQRLASEEAKKSIAQARENAAIAELRAARKAAEATPLAAAPVSEAAAGAGKYVPPSQRSSAPQPAQKPVDGKLGLENAALFPSLKP